MNKWETKWADLPDTMSFDDLIAHPLYARYVDNGFIWQVLLSNGAFYTMDSEDRELGCKCQPAACLDRIFI